MNESPDQPFELSEDFHWIVSDEAQTHLEMTSDHLCNGIEFTRVLKSLRKITTPARASLILELANLRIRARCKFQKADRMFFTRDSLEMATDEKIAAYKSGRFSNCLEVADVCCGIGGDLLGLMTRDQKSAFGFDTDPVAIKFANKNLEVHNLAGVAEVQSFESIIVDHFEAVHIDPERRKFGKSVSGDKFSPALNSILAQIKKTDFAIKVAPATELSNTTSIEDCEYEWIGHSRECKQQVIWTGGLARYRNSHVATVVDGLPFSYHSTIENIDATRPSYCSEIGPLVYEPHNTVLAARLTDCLAQELGLQRIHAGIAYLTGDSRVSNPLLSAFEVLDWLPADFKKVSAAVHQFGFGEIEFKKRGVSDSVVAPFKKIKRGKQKKIGTLIFTEFRNQHIVIITKRVA